MASGRRGVRLQKAACCRWSLEGYCERERRERRVLCDGSRVSAYAHAFKVLFCFCDRATYETVFVRSWRKVDVTFCKIWTRSRTNMGPSGCQVQTSRLFSLNRTTANLLRVRRISLPTRKKPHNRTHSYITVFIYSRTGRLTAVT